MVQLTSTLVLAALLTSSALAVPVAHDHHHPELADRTIHVHLRHHNKHTPPHREHDGSTHQPEQATEKKLNLREDEDEAFARAFDDIDLDELAARNPSFGSFFKKIKKTVGHVATPGNIAKAAKFVAPLVLREDEGEMLVRAFEHPALQELAERDPSFGSFFKKIKKTVSHLATPKNLAKAAAFAPLILREDEVDAFKRSFDDNTIERIAAREPSFGSFFKKVKKAVSHVVTPGNIAKVAKFAPLVLREDIDGADLLGREDVHRDLIARAYAQYDLDALD
jgi:hypothetical protein